MLPWICLELRILAVRIPSYDLLMILAFGAGLGAVLWSRELPLAGWRLAGLSTVFGAAVCRYLAPVLSGAAPGGSSAFFAWALPSFLLYVGLCRVFRVSVPATLDAILPAVLLASSIGRVGCLLAGCCHGIPLHPPLGWPMPGATAGPGTYLPTQALHGIADLAAFLTVRWLRLPAPGARAFAAAGFYLSERFAIGFLRHGRRLSGFTHGQIAATLCMLFWVPAFLRWRARHPRPHPARGEGTCRQRAT